MIVCPKCRYKSNVYEEWDIGSVINGIRIQIRCPECEEYTCFIDETYEEIE